MNILEAFKASNCEKAKCLKTGKTYSLNGVYELRLKYIAENNFEPVNETLTFECIRKECVAGKTLLINSSNTKHLFCGWDHLGRILLQYLKDDGFCPKPQPYHEAGIKDWRIGGKFERVE